MNLDFSALIYSPVSLVAATKASVLTMFKIFRTYTCGINIKMHTLEFGDAVQPLQ